MDCKVIWTDEAIADLRQIVAYIAKDNPVAVVRLGEEHIGKSLSLSSEQPRVGRIQPKFGRDTLRELVIRPHRLIYEIDDVSMIVKIRVVWHGARREPNIQ